MKLILVRHGETKENVLGIIQGHSHNILNRKGLAQARKVARRLKKEKIDLAYSSDLERCVQTAQEIFKFHPHIKLQLSPLLREQGKGIYDGKPRESWKNSLQKSGKPWFDFKAQGGETLLQVQHRTQKFFKNIITKHKNKTVLVVTHGGPLICLYLLLFKEGFEKFRKYQMDNTAVTFLEIESLNKHKVRVLNCVKHLK